MRYISCCRPLILGCYRSTLLRNQILLAPRVLVYRNISNEENKRVQDMLRMLREDLKQEKEEEDKRVVVSGDTTEKLPLKTRILNELKHYYHGFRLLALEVKVSSKYAWMVLRGKTLTRLERQQLIRTLTDIFRLVPFSVFIIVPFMEFALPIFIKLFPNMLPSTFQEKAKEEEKFRKQIKMRRETAKFIQDTLEELAVKKNAQTKKGEEHLSKAFEFAQFMKKVRSEGAYVTNEEILKFTKLFEDELTLDNLALSQLRALCRLLGVNTIGSPEILRFQLVMKLRELKNDDRMIAAEGGVDALNVTDLQAACRARGMRSLGVYEERLRSQLKSWLEMSLNDKIPPTMLLLSRALYLPEELTFKERLKTILTVMPNHLSEQTKQKLTEIEGGKVGYKDRLQLILSIEESLKAEREIQEQHAARKEKEKEREKAKIEEEKKQKDEADSEKVDKETLEVEQPSEDKLGIKGELDDKKFEAKTPVRAEEEQLKMEENNHSHDAKDAKFQVKK